MYNFSIECDNIDKEYTQLVYILEKKFRDDWDISNKIVIKDAYVDLKELISWFRANETEILSEELPVFVQNQAKSNLTIKEKLDIYYDSFFDNDELPPNNEGNIIDEYNKKHCVAFGAHGTDIRYAYIGKNNGVLEFSYVDKHEKWQFAVDLNEFFTKIKIEVII
jgi:hypothetical protein